MSGRQLLGLLLVLVPVVVVLRLFDVGWRHVREGAAYAVCWLALVVMAFAGGWLLGG